MVHRIAWRVTSEDALAFWAERLGAEGLAVERTNGSLAFADPEGLGHELLVVETSDEPLIADHPEVPKEVALQGFDSVRAYAFDPEQSRHFLEQTLAFSPEGEAAWEVRGDRRGSFYRYDRSDQRGIGGAGTVHHVAWASPMDDQEAWQRRVAEAGASPTPIIDRFYFRSIYFREPSGVLFEIATIGPGFDVDEPLAELGEHLSLPPAYEQLRDRLEQVLTPLPDTRRQLATGGR